MYTDLIKNKLYYSTNIPKTTVPSPTENDYITGYIQRYFIQKFNDEMGFVFEVDKSTYDELQYNPYWYRLELRWRIKGPIDPVYDDEAKIIDMGVKASNQSSLNIASEKLKNIRLYIPNLLQFYK